MYLMQGQDISDTIELSEPQNRYVVQSLLESLPVPVLEVDISLVLKSIEDERGRENNDLLAAYRDNPDTAAKWNSKIKVLHVNQAVVELFGAQSKAELIAIWDQQAHNSPAQGSFKGMLCWNLVLQNQALWQESCERADGRWVFLQMMWSAPGRIVDSPDTVYLSLTDITENREESESFAEITRALLGTRDREDVLQLISDSAQKLIPRVERSVIHLLDPNTNTLQLVAGAGLEELDGPTFTMHPGEGIAGRVLVEGEPINVGDTMYEPHYLPLGAGENLRSLLVVPIRKGDDLLGTLSVRSRRSHAFSPENERLLTNLGTQAAVAIENARLFEATELRLKEVQTLYRITQVIAEFMDLDHVVRQVVQLVLEYFNAYYVQLFLLDEGRKQLVIRQGSGTVGAQRVQDGYTLTESMGFTGWVADSGEISLANDVTRSVIYQPDTDLPETSAELAVPLQAANKLIGVLDIHLASGNTFSENDLDFARTVADQLAVAVENATLYKGMQTALHQEQQMRHQLVQGEKLAALGRIVASVAHELNNPLQTIHNSLYLVHLEDLPNQQVQEDLQVAMLETNRMADLIERLRETYRPATEKDFAYESLNDIICEVEKLLSTHMRHNQVTLVFVPDTSIPTVPIIRDQIKQVVLNISLNAVEAMTSGGELTIDLRMDTNNRGVQMLIRDSGPGIPPEVCQNIFDPFFTTKDGGTGLGLAITYDIIQRHRGNITVRSIPDSGTEFDIWLPLDNQSIEEAAIAVGS